MNISEGHKKTADGVVQLQEAQKHQKKARGKVVCISNCWRMTFSSILVQIIGLLIVVVVIAVIVGVIVYLKVK